MNATLTLQFPLAWQVGLPLALTVVLIIGWRQRRAGMAVPRILGLGFLRFAVLGVLLLLASKPVTIEKRTMDTGVRRVVVLLDRSESMSVRDEDETRFQQASSFLKSRLLGALERSGLGVDTFLFDESAEPLGLVGRDSPDGPAPGLGEAALGALNSVKPTGRRTNLGGAIAQTLSASAQRPIAIVALTDGIANQNTDNARAWAALSENRIPVIAVGFGSDQGARSLSLRNAEAPRSVAAKASFHVSAQLELLNGREIPPVQLLLLRDGQLLQTRNIEPGAGSRTWLENFEVTEARAGTHNYTVQLLPPVSGDLKCANVAASTSVRIEDERELRVLYIQGALTWDYKFVGLALREDRSMKLTGLSRTSEKSVFRQNVEGAGELLNGFPQTMEELAPFRVVILSNLRANDLSPAQQELLARFCRERGGGLLLLGGPATFDISWRGSPLEKAFPVIFAASPGVQGLDKPFHLELTRQALDSPVFKLDENLAPEAAWKRLPTFSDYGRVDAAKPGAEVWAVHPGDEGPNGSRILMASQRYGAGMSAVICIQNFWRWRLAPDQEPASYDRFWRQMFRYLSDAGRQDVSIQFAEQDLQPHSDLHVLLGLEPNPSLDRDAKRKFLVKVESRGHRLVKEQAVDLQALRPTDLAFRAEEPGLYTVSVSDSAKVPIATRAVDVRDVNVELQNTARDMESLRQWASVSDGLALKAEDCPDAVDLLTKIRSRIQEAGAQTIQQKPYGINAWVLAGLLGLLAAEWSLRKVWGLA